MKRLITLSLAALMVLSLSATAFAAVGNMYDHGGMIEKDFNTASPKSVGDIVLSMPHISAADVDASNDDILYANPFIEYADKDYSYVQPGWTVYYMLMAEASFDRGTDTRVDFIPATVSDAVKSVKVTAKYKLGNDVIESMKVVYKKTEGPMYDGYCYWLAVQTKEFEGTGFKDFAAEVTLKKSSGSEKKPADPNKASYAFEMKADIMFRIRLDDNKARGLNIYKNAFQLNFADVDPDSEETIEFPGTNGVYYEVCMFSQGRTIVSMSLDFDQEVINKFPAANMDFYNGNGAKFNVDGTLVIPADEGSFIYGRDAEGNLVAIEAEYDSSEEAFKVVTKTLGSYVVSDIELDLEVINEPTEEPVPDDGEEVKAPVPTGAYA